MRGDPMARAATSAPAEAPITNAGAATAPLTSPESAPAPPPGVGLCRPPAARDPDKSGDQDPYQGTQQRCQETDHGPDAAPDHPDPDGVPFVSLLHGRILAALSGLVGAEDVDVPIPPATDRDLDGLASLSPFQLAVQQRRP